MKRTLTRIKPRRFVETEFAPGGFGSHHNDDEKSRQSLVARWIVAEDGKLICQWVAESRA